jgi:phytoene synthase
LDEDGHRDFAVNMGLAVQTVNILRDVKGDAEKGRVYLPREDLRRFGVTEADLRSPRLEPATLRLLRFEATRAREFFAAAKRGLPALSRKAARPAVAMGVLYERLLDKIERGDFLWGAPRPSLSLWEKAGVVLACLTY